MAERPSQVLLVPSRSPRLAPFRPPRPTQCVGHIVLITSVILVTASALLALAAGVMSHAKFPDEHAPTSKWDERDTSSSFVVAYSSAATLLFSAIIEHIYILSMPGIVVYAAEDALATLGVRRWFWIVSSCYWICFVAGETLLIVAIKGLYDREPRWALFVIAAVLDIFTALVTIGLDSIASYIADNVHLRILLRDDPMTTRINVPPEFVVESADYEDCTICIEPPDVGDRVREMRCCQHTFHTACIDRWLSESPQCPLCRRGV